MDAGDAGELGVARLGWLPGVFVPGVIPSNETRARLLGGSFLAETGVVTRVLLKNVNGSAPVSDEYPPGVPGAGDEGVVVLDVVAVRGEGAGPGGSVAAVATGIVMICRA